MTLYGAILLGLIGAGATVQAFAAIRGKVYGDFSAGMGYDDSVLQDSSKHESVLVPLTAGVGWRGRLSPVTTGLGFTRLSYMGYPGRTSESNIEWDVLGSLKYRFYGPLSLLLEGDAMVYRQPNLTTFNENRVFFAPGIEAHLLPDSRLRLQAIVEKDDYPKYDLDSRAFGFQTRFLQDVSLQGELILDYRQMSRDFTERRLFANTAGAWSSALREDTQKRAVGSFRWDWDAWDASAGYAWERLTSNGNSLDYGPGQTSTTNTIAGDERLTPDYYSYSLHGPLLLVNLRALQPYLLSVYSRWETVDYDQRVAKDAQDQFRPGNPTRLDHRHLIGIDLTRTYPRGRIRLGWTARLSRETIASNEALYDYTHYRGMLLFRGWF
jgi:hypothetical protein